MEGKATFCDTCKEVAFLIDDYYTDQKAKFDRKTGLPFSPTGSEDCNRVEIILGTLKDLQGRTECTSCQDIVHSLVQSGRIPPAHEVMEFEYKPRQWLSIRGETYYLDLWRLENPNQAHEVGRLFDPQQVNVELLRQWVYCCHTSHKDHCLRIEIPSTLSLIYLIDVVEGCLISANMETKYVALSYVWGNFRTIQTTKTNLAYLRRPGSIGVRGNNLKFGKTIEDALRLVSLLGERYLWIDCLCIVQDDFNTKQESLNAMGSIYANAYLTIVAADGHHADHGLRGLGHGSQNRSVGCNIIRFPFETDVVAHLNRAWYPEDSPWESRAWTFQEALFSRRLLIFNGTASWFCRAAIWEEHVNKPTENVGYPPVAINVSHVPFAARSPTWPDLERWARLVESFNTRKLTFEEDVMDASAGLRSIFDGCFSGGVLWGIPEMFFDHCMIWRPKKVLRRRRAYNHALLAEFFPSWSWVAWEGDLRLVNALSALDDVPENDSQKVQIHPLAQWYKSTEPTSSLYPIKNIDHCLRLHRVELGLEAEQLPSGWAQGLYPDGTFFFTHETVPNRRFRYPIPLKNESTRPSIDEHGRYLHYKTQRTRLFLGREIVDYNKIWTTCVACLSDSEGKWAGSIRLNASRSNYVPSLDEWDIPERPRDSEFYHFYYVMWVEWYAGIAYRKAIGTVYKPVWDRQVREDIDVILG
ncbi:heterokaryon incompatibility protein-domain-containing protein [Usnea florida]